MVWWFGPPPPPLFPSRCPIHLFCPHNVSTLTHSSSPNTQCRPRYWPSPSILALTFGEEAVNEGDTAAVQCTVCTVVKGDAPLTIAWTLDGRELRAQDHPGVQITALGPRISTLSIEQVRAAHIGEYTCTATNRGGATAQSTQLHVLGTHATCIPVARAGSASLYGVVD
ncbi:hypothetical protein FOCC_FOCC013987 [Frankliniella occidentalis]|nr:hypothetical protein FOCC_FOCC013987 [Frankliniella occidentalis]